MSKGDCCTGRMMQSATAMASLMTFIMLPGVSTRRIVTLEVRSLERCNPLRQAHYIGEQRRVLFEQLVLSRRAQISVSERCGSMSTK